MKKIINNKVMHGVFIIFLAIALMQGLFRLGSFVFMGTFSINGDAKAVGAFLGLIMGIGMCIYHFVENDD